MSIPLNYRALLPWYSEVMLAHCFNKSLIIITYFWKSRSNFAKMCREAMFAPNYFISSLDYHVIWYGLATNKSHFVHILRNFFVNVHISTAQLRRQAILQVWTPGAGSNSTEANRKIAFNRERGDLFSCCMFSLPELILHVHFKLMQNGLLYVLEVKPRS